MKYLIDTDWIIDHLKGQDKVVRKLEELTPEGMAISVISLAEIYEGVYYSKDLVRSQRLLEKFLAPDLEVLNVDHVQVQATHKMPTVPSANCIF